MARVVGIAAHFSGHHHRHRMTSQGRVTLRDHMFKRFDLTQGTVERKTVTEFVPNLHSLEKYLGVQLNEAERAQLQAIPVSQSGGTAAG